MKVLVVLANPGKKTFNHAIADAAVETLRDGGHEVIFHDLYAEEFDPVLTREEMPKDGVLTPEIERHCGDVAEAEGIVVVHPNWWGMPPAILKGWVDRVIRPGVAYEFVEGDGGEGVPVGLLKARTAVVFNTTNTHEEREQKVFGDPLESIWKSCIFGLCGVSIFYRKSYGVVVTSSSEQREEWLADVRRTMEKHFPPATR